MEDDDAAADGGLVADDDDAAVEIAFGDGGAPMVKYAYLMAVEWIMAAGVAATNLESVDEDDGDAMGDAEERAAVVVDDSMCEGDYVIVEVDALVDVVDAS